MTAATEKQALSPSDTLGYLRELFEPGDFIDLQFIHQTDTIPGTDRKQTRDEFVFIDAIGEQTLQMIRVYQQAGWNSYVCMNALKQEVDPLDGKHHRRERDVVGVRSVYVDCDVNALDSVNKIADDIEAELLPEPQFIIRSSPSKFYVLWKVQGMTVLEAKALNKALQSRYHTDAAATDAARVLRMIGTYNLKPEYTTNGQQPMVVLDDEFSNFSNVAAPRYTLADFHIPVEVPKLVERSAAPEKVAQRLEYYEIACDNAGVEPGDLVEKSDGSFAYIVACPNVDEHTNGAGEYDASVWVSPSGHLAFGCFHAHCKDKNWVNYYRPWLEQQAQDNGYEGRLRFGDASEVEPPTMLSGGLRMEGSMTNPATPAPATAAATAAATATAVAEPVVEEPQAEDDAEEDTRAWPHSDTFRPMTDFGNAERLVDHFGYDIRYLDKNGKWMEWQEVRWTQTGKTGPQAKMQAVVRTIYDESEALAALNGDIARKMRTWAKRSESNTAISGAILQARGLRELRADMSEFDANPMLFNVLNGTLDLTNRKFYPHRREDMLTKVANVRFDKDATCPRWEAFLEKSMPDADTRRFLQQAVGYSLTGETNQDCLFLNIGNGRNGKGVFLNTLKFLLGDYSMQANFDSFVAAKGGSGGISIRTDIARMSGARMVIASENEQEARLAEGLLKTLTGSDTVTARKLYEEEQEYIPQFKLWFAVNNEPKIIGVDDGIWSRIYLILWKVFIKPEERDPNLKKYLIENELPGILNWALKGLRDYQQAGKLVPSEAVTAAGQEFRHTSDQVQRFFDEKCVLGEGGEVSSEKLYESYKNWSKDVKEFQLNAKQFTNYLLKRGFVRHRDRSSGKDILQWLDIQLRSQLGGNSGNSGISNNPTVHLNSGSY